MKTYQDLEKAKTDGKLELFIAETIDEYRSSPAYSAMVDAEKYHDGENPAIMNMVSELRLGGGTSVDILAKIRVPTGIFGRMMTQLVNRLWFNSIQLDSPKIKEKLGKNFDKIAKDIATKAAIHGVGYGFWEDNKIVKYSPLEYLPLPDEEDATHKAGIGFWQIAEGKPWQIRLFEMDGYTKYSRDKNRTVRLKEKKRDYILNVYKDKATGAQITGGENYPGFPILPMYANTKHKSELSAPIKAKIDLYDAIWTSFGNDVMRTRLVYWVLKGYSGDVDTLLELRASMERLGIIAPTDETEVKSELTDIPADGVMKILDRLESEIYRDAGVMNAKEIMGGSLTNVAIKTAQIGENMKASDMEWNAADFVDRLLALIGIENESITFKHETITNDLEITQRLAMYPELDLETKLTLDPMFPPEQIAGILKRVEANVLTFGSLDLDDGEPQGGDDVDGQGD